MKKIIEKELGISGDYQYKALRNGNYLQSNWHNNKLVILRHLMNNHLPQTVLDLGTGSGNFELTFADQLDSIVGMDYNSDALDFLAKELKKRKIKNVKLIEQDILSLPKYNPKEKFDMIIMVDVIEHLENKSNKAMVKHFKKLLNPKGKVVIITPNYNGIWVIIEQMLDRFNSVPQLSNMQHVTKFNSKNLEKLFKDHGYNQISASTFNTFSIIFPNQAVSARMSKLEHNMGLPFGSLLVSVFEA